MSQKKELLEVSGWQLITYFLTKFKISLVFEVAPNKGTLILTRMTTFAQALQLFYALSLHL